VVEDELLAPVFLDEHGSVAGVGCGDVEVE
jgi:hypothetical protein